MDSTLLKYSAKDYFFKAALCHFCVDMLNAKVSPSHYDFRLNPNGQLRVPAETSLLFLLACYAKV